MSANPEPPFVRMPPGQTQAGVPDSEVASPRSAAPVSLSGIELWLHRFSSLIFVLFCAMTGVLLIILPWTDVWTDNYLLTRFPLLRPVIASGFLRGLCTGLGILDVWIGFSEAVHYHETKQT